MRKLLLLLTLIAVAFIAINRHRLYLRDPLGTVYVNEVKQTGIRVFINYSNDVLIQQGDGPRIEEYLIQGWNSMPGVPAELKCLRDLACLAPADHAPMAPLPGATRAEMTSRQVVFTNGSKGHVRITLW